MIVATYSITDERKEKVAFAGPYFIAGQDLLVRADDTSITGPDDLDGKKLCSVTGSTSAQKVKDKSPGVQLQEFGTYSECVAALVSKGVDALTTDNTILAGYAAQEHTRASSRSSASPSPRSATASASRRATPPCARRSTTALDKMVDDGDWQKAVDENLGPAGYKSTRRPTRRRRTPAPDPHARVTVCRPPAESGGIPPRVHVPATERRLHA